MRPTLTLFLFPSFIDVLCRTIGTEMGISPVAAEALAVTLMISLVPTYDDSDDRRKDAGGGPGENRRGGLLDRTDQ